VCAIASESTSESTAASASTSAAARSTSTETSSASKTASSTASAATAEEGGKKEVVEVGSEVDEREWYTVGIIDVLQKFNAAKRAEG
jgi:hypothetical protein